MPEQNQRPLRAKTQPLPTDVLRLHTAADDARRRRYSRSPADAPFVSLTPTKVKMLLFLAEMRFLSLPQIARLCCPAERRDLSEKSARRQMRALFDAGLVDVLPVSRAALAPSEAPNDASLLYGSAPNVYTLAAAGLDALYKAGLRDQQSKSRTKPTYGPKNSLFLAHELAVRDVRVWLEEVARRDDYNLEAWHDGEEAVIDLARTQMPYQVRPDAWFVLRLPKAILVSLVEVDRGTERGDRHWREKLTAYEALFAGKRLPEVTGYVNARVLVVTPSSRRRDQLAEIVGEFNGACASKLWVAQNDILSEPNLHNPQWRQQTDQPLKPLILSHFM